MGYIVIFLSSCISEIKSFKNTEQVDEFLDGQSAYFNFNGNVLLADKGEIVFQKSYGYADFETGRLLNDSSVFELASVSKQFTATAILMLKDQGMLKLTDSLRLYFPELPYHDITLYHMLTHTSGLPDYEYSMIDHWDHNKIASNQDMIEFLAREKPPVTFLPGAGWAYNNTAYALLASIIEKVSGQPYRDFMSSNIFRPLKMNHTRVYNHLPSEETPANYAGAFNLDDFKNNRSRPGDESELNGIFPLDGIQGHVAISSTTTDLLKWDRSVKDHALLSEDTQQEMVTEQTEVDPRYQSSYGFGVYLTRTDLGKFIHHSGRWPGYYNFLARNIDRDQTIIVLSNNESNSRQIGMALYHIMNDKPVVMPYEHKEIKMEPAILEQFTGKYKNIAEISIILTGDTLFRVAEGKPNVELKPESPTKFFYGDGTDRQLEFELDSNKSVIKAWFIGYGMKIEYQKL